MRFSLQPLDAAPDPKHMLMLIDEIGSDEVLMFSTDYPHWQFDALAEGLSKMTLPHGSGATVMAEDARAHDKLPVCAGRA
jgi:uncharacterized protein